MIISDSIPSVINGISQQPDPLRLTSQCTLQENGYSSPVKGVRKRPPFRHVAQLFNTNGYDSAYLHTINRDTTERYNVVITNGDLKVFAIDGTTRTVSFPSGKAYLTNTNPAQGFVALTVEDYTFIANKGITCAMGAAVSTVRNHEAIVYVKQAIISGVYTVTINGQTATYTASSTTPLTDAIANNLTTGLNAIGALTAVMTITQYGSVIYIQSKSAGVDFTLSTTDGFGNQALIPVKDQIQRFTNLPPNAVNGFQVKIVGDNNGSYTGYYVQYVAASSGSPNGVWVETTAQGVTTGFDATTMPWQLVRNGDGTFTFDKASWTPRAVGDDTSAPQPSLIGRTIADIFFHRNRLGFAAGQNVVFSKAGFYFNYWPDTVTQVLDTDRIDVGVNNDKVSTIRAVVPFQDSLIVFSDQTQFVLDGGDLMSPKSITIKPSTEFENDSQFCRPLYSGKTAFFPVPRGSFEGIREFQTLPVNDQKDAVDITSHVPDYLPSGVFKIACSSNDGMLVALSANDRSSLYIYKFLWNGAQKEQSCWSRWPLDPGDTILNVDFIQTDMYIVVERADGVYLEVCHLGIGTIDTGFTYQVNLDRLVSLTGTYSSGTGLTTWTLPYANTNGVFQAVLGSTFTSPNRVGTALALTKATSTTVTAVGNYSGGPVWIGRQYTMRYRFSHIFPRAYVKGQGYTVAAVQEGRLQLNHMTITFEQSGYFRAEVTPYARSMASYQYTGLVAGDQSMLVGARPVVDGVFRFPVFTNAATGQIDLVNDTYLPCGIQSAEWEGKYFIRSQRI